MSPKSTRRTRRLFSYRNLLLVLLLACTVGVCLKATRTHAVATLTVMNTNDSGAGSLRQASAGAASGGHHQLQPRRMPEHDHADIGPVCSFEVAQG